MSTLKTHNLQSPDAGSVNIAMTPNAGMVVTGISTFTGAIDVDGHANLDNVSIAGVTTIGNRAFITHDLTITGTAPRLILSDTDHNSDLELMLMGEYFRLRTPQIAMLIG